MSQPKSKTSRARRDRRRYASGNRMAPITWTLSPLNNEPVRTHRVTLETIDGYIAARDQRKAEKRKQASR